jgi:hypothetical protein
MKGTDGLFAGYAWVYKVDVLQQPLSMGFVPEGRHPVRTEGVRIAEAVTGQGFAEIDQGWFFRRVHLSSLDAVC